MPVDFRYKSSDFKADYFVATNMPAGCSPSDLRLVLANPQPELCAPPPGFVPPARAPGLKTKSALTLSSPLCSISKVYMAGTCTSERNNRGSGCRSGSNGTVVPNTFSSSIDPAVCRSVFVNGPSGAAITLADTGE